MTMMATLLYKLNPASCLRPDIDDATIDGDANDKQSVATMTDGIVQIIRFSAFPVNQYPISFGKTHTFPPRPSGLL